MANCRWSWLNMESRTGNNCSWRGRKVNPSFLLTDRVNSVSLFVLASVRHGSDDSQIRDFFERRSVFLWLCYRIVLIDGRLKITDHGDTVCTVSGAGFVRIARFRRFFFNEPSDTTFKTSQIWPNVIIPVVCRVCHLLATENLGGLWRLTTSHPFRQRVACFSSWTIWKQKPYWYFLFCWCAMLIVSLSQTV